MDDTKDQFGALYERLFALCAPLEFPPPWGFLPPRGCCRGPLRDPEAALAALRAEFPEALLAAAGVLEQGPGCPGRLDPALAAPDAAVVAFRRRPDGPPFALLAPGGCLPGGRCPVAAALEDGPTQEAANAGALFAAAGAREAALLRALGMPATLAPGPDTLGAAALEMLDERFSPSCPWSWWPGPRWRPPPTRPRP